MICKIKIRKIVYNNLKKKEKEYILIIIKVIIIIIIKKIFYNINVNLQKRNKDHSIIVDPNSPVKKIIPRQNVRQMSNASRILRFTEYFKMPDSRG